jgi:hypothetical protein
MTPEGWRELAEDFVDRDNPGEVWAENLVEYPERYASMGYDPSSVNEGWRMTLWLAFLREICGKIVCHPA